MRRPRRPPGPTPRPARGSVALEARDVHVQLGRRPVLESVDVQVRAGELVAVIGPNGAGKSTLLQVLAGDRPPDRGDVVVDGRPLRSWSAAELGRRRAVLPQSTTLAFPFSVRHVVEMGRAPWRRRPEGADDAEAVATAMAATDVTGLGHRVFTTLSGGERARVALARVLAQRAPRLLLDEPTAALDLRHQQLVLAIARGAAEAGDAVVVVLHDLELAGTADRVVLLAGGRVEADGPPRDVLRPALVSQVYRHPVDVVTHPVTGAPVVLARPPGSGAT